MIGAWFEEFRLVCENVCAAGEYEYGPSVVLFYVARWSQKATRELEPDPLQVDRHEVHSLAERVARNLLEDGHSVDRLFAGDADEFTALRRSLLSSALPRAGDAATEFADEALQKISLVLLTGTPPSRAEQALVAGPNGPANEYIFTAPFRFWAKSVVINLIRDEHRQEKRRRRGTVAATQRKEFATPRDGELQSALRSLPDLLDAIRALPHAQRSVMVMSLCRRDVEEVLLEHLQQEAPDLFGRDAPRPESDTEIAQLLGTKPHLVAANRSAARRKLIRDPEWEQLLDALLPHRSTRPPLMREANRA